MERNSCLPVIRASSGRRSGEKWRDGIAGTSPAGAANSPDSDPEEIPTVTVPDKNPSCPCCGSRTDRVLDLIEHLKRAHGQSKVCVRCAGCGKESLNPHSIVCHYPKCKGTSRRAPPGDWVCEVCGKDFSTKIGVGQHKRHVHPDIRRQERIAASRPKENSARGAHKRVWTKEEEQLLIELELLFEGNKNINKQIADHIPSKTAKQISDKRRLLHKGPAGGVGKEPEMTLNQKMMMRSSWGTWSSGGASNTGECDMPPQWESLFVHATH